MTCALRSVSYLAAEFAAWVLRERRVIILPTEVATARRVKTTSQLSGVPALIYLFLNMNENERHPNNWPKEMLSFLCAHQLLSFLAQLLASANMLNTVASTILTSHPCN